MMLLHTNIDLIAGLSHRCVMDFNQLKNAVSTTSTMHMRETQTQLMRSRSSHKVAVDEADLEPPEDHEDCDCNGDSSEVIDKEADESMQVQQSALLPGPSHGPAEPCTVAPTREPPALRTVQELRGKSSDKIVEA